MDLPGSSCRPWPGWTHSGLYQKDFLLTWDKTEDEIRARC
jgi:hypothetical protein